MSGFELTAIKMGRAIGDALKADGIAQTEFAQRVGVSEKHLSQVVTGAGVASPAQLDLWAFALGRRWSVALTEVFPDGTQ